MKQKIKEFIHQALLAIGISAEDKINIDYTRDSQHGDLACNIALLLAKQAGRKPYDIAHDIVSHIPSHPLIEKIQIANPGFINFVLSAQAWQRIVIDIINAGQSYGRSTLGKGKRIHIEFVSSNPTGPLHVGHGRGAAYGATLADLLSAIGCEVHREYYVNDGGRQMDILATSIWLRYLELCNESFPFPSNGYQGDYVVAIARHIKDNYGTQFKHAVMPLINAAPSDQEDKEAHIDTLIASAKQLLGESAYQKIFDIGLQTILADIRDDLSAFGVNFQAWFSEKSLISSGAVEHAIAKLRDKGHLYEKEGAVWFHATAFGDDKDRVVIRENGQYTYFANDIAYHLHKYEQGYTEVIDILGADHHGYIPRLKAVITALGYSVKHFFTPIVQFATLYRGNQRVQMSTRSGSFVTLRELREEVGKDAARFFYVLRKADQHMDFDLELAKSQSNDNPVYYIQYAHARICSVFRQLEEKQLSWDRAVGMMSLDQLETIEEKNLLIMLGRYPETVELAALQYEPHLIAHYLRDLANSFHTYYNAHPFLVTADALRQARLCLVDATRQVLINGLQLLSVSAPETM